MIHAEYVFTYKRFFMIIVIVTVSMSMIGMNLMFVLEMGCMC